MSDINTISYSIQRYISKLTTGEALLFAKKEIEHAPIITRDPDLYAPVFRNLSIFKRYIFIIRTSMQPFTSSAMFIVWRIFFPVVLFLDFYHKFV